MSDYIEREAALEIVKRTSGDYAAAWREIAHTPAADVAPVRHGKFNFVQEDIPYCNYGVCDVCGAYVQAWNYCPNCGAKMQPVGNSE